ncbi:MAG: substrate-binding domain-containing protein, partial [Devosia sp.]
ALARHGIAYDPDIVFQTGFGEDDGYFIVDAMIDNEDPVTAIVLIFEAAAIGIYRRLEERGLRPGYDLAVIGFRNEAMIRHLRPRLTCFEVSLSEIGIALGSALLGQLAPREKRQIAQVKVPLTLRLGESDQPISPQQRPSISKRIQGRVPVR